LLKREVDAELKALEGVRQLCLRLVEVRRDLADGEATFNQLNANGRRRKNTDQNFKRMSSTRKRPVISAWTTSRA
jgi:hypothetical protein